MRPQNFREVEPARRQWIDIAKGGMILLVVFGHAWRGLASHEALPSDLFSAVDSRIYAFHMPTFFALSGWFFISSLESKTLFEFYRGRILRLFWPMVLWTYIFLGLKALADQYTNTPISWEDVLVSPVPGVLHMWFLWALLILSVTFSFLKFFSRNRKIPDAALWITVVLVFIIQFVPLSDGAREWIGSAVRNAPFFLIGVIGGRVITLNRTPFVFRLLATLVFVAILSVLPFVREMTSAFLVSFSLTICALIVLSGFGAEAESWVSKVLTVLGTASMPIFLAHTIFSASLREAFWVIGIDNLWVHLSLGTVIGVAGPLFLMHLARRLQVVRLFGF